MHCQLYFIFIQDRLRAPPGKQLNHSPAGVWLKPHCFEIDLVTQDLSCVATAKLDRSIFVSFSS